MNAPFDPVLLTNEKFPVGQPVSRREDPVLLRGEGRYTDDPRLADGVSEHDDDRDAATGRDRHFALAGYLDHGAGEEREGVGVDAADTVGIGNFVHHQAISTRDDGDDRNLRPWTSGNGEVDPLTAVVPPGLCGISCQPAR
jgi:hypothetical protein